MIVSKITRHLRYPSMLVPGVSPGLGSLLGRYEFGSSCSIEPLCSIWHPERLEVGNGTYIKNHSVLKPKEPDGITIGDDCSLNQFTFLAGCIELGDGVRVANQVSMHSFNHRIERSERIHEQDLDMGEIVIEDDVWIGTGARILKDVHIGEGAVVGAGSVVTDDVGPYTIVAGSPAQQIGER